MNRTPVDNAWTRWFPRGWYRLLVVAAGLLLAVAGAGGWATLNVLPYAIIGTDRSPRWQIYHNATPAGVGLAADDFWCEVESGLWLRGWFSQAAGTARGTVVLLHGHNNCKESNIALAKLLASRGFHCLFYDSRGCGESGGKFCTYGFYEHLDCSRCLDELLRRYGAATVGPTAIYGSSFGGAVALQTMAADRRFHCGVVESTFVTLPEVVRDYAWHLSGVRLDWLTNVALQRAGVLAKFSPEAVRPENAADAIRQPALLIHGTADRDISVAYGERIFRHLNRAPGSEWYPVPGGGHDDLWRVGGEPYRQKILEFLDRWDR